MPINITIGNTVIPFPSAGTDASWAEPVIEFAQAVEEALLGAGGPFDLSPRVQILSLDGNTNLDISGAVFPSGFVRSFRFNYTAYRVNDSLSVVETGIINGTYDTFNTAWIIEQEFNGSKQSSGVAYQTFAMSGDQLQITTTAIGGVYDGSNSRLSYSAKTELVSNP